MSYYPLMLHNLILLLKAGTNVRVPFWNICISFLHLLFFFFLMHWQKCFLSVFCNNNLSQLHVYHRWGCFELHLNPGLFPNFVTEMLKQWLVPDHYQNMSNSQRSHVLEIVNKRQFKTVSILGSQNFPSYRWKKQN